MFRNLKKTKGIQLEKNSEFFFLPASLIVFSLYIVISPNQHLILKKNLYTKVVFKDYYKS